MANQKQDGLMVMGKNIMDSVTNKVRGFREKGELHFPAGYSAENAMKQAWLVLQDTKDRNNKLALEICNKGSIVNSLMSMVVQGLSPDKKQCYFIVYGDKLTLQRSYFGAMAVAKRVCPEIQEIYADVVYKDDVFEYEKKHGKTLVIKHSQQLENVSKDKIVAAYCTVVYKDGREETTIMAMDQILQAWAQSAMKPVSDKGTVSAGSVHGKFKEEMCKKTVINRTCKLIINSSDDSTLLIEYAKKSEQDSTYEEVMEESTQNANTIIVDDYEIDTTTGEVKAEEIITEEIINTTEEEFPQEPMQDPGF